MTKNELFSGLKGCFMDDPQACASYLHSRSSKCYEQIMKTADEVTQQAFQFELRWDMERTSEPVCFPDKIDWLYQPGDDPEWIFQMNRHRYWICLGQAYALTGDERYASCFRFQMLDWIDSVPFDPQSPGWRTIEAGLRTEYWLKAMSYFEKSPSVDDELCIRFVESLKEHGRFMCDVYDDFRLMSNWGILQNHGLYLLGALLPPDNETEEFLKKAGERLEEEVRIQVYPGGMHWEQSPMYQAEVTMCLLDVVTAAVRKNKAIPEIIIAKTEELCRGLMLTAKPNHHEIMQGDSDDIDVRDILQRGACLFQDSELKGGGGNDIDPDLVWEVGIGGLETYRNLDLDEPDITRFFNEESGNYYYRSDWSEKAFFLHFHNGTLGAGHSHADKLHIDLHYQGEDILVDPGRYTYVGGDERYRFKSASAHNRIFLQDRESYPPADSWMCHNLGRPLKQSGISREGILLLQGGTLEYTNLPENNDVFLHRRVVILPDDIVVISDLAVGDEQAFPYQNFHFSEEGKLTLESETIARYENNSSVSEFIFTAPTIKLKCRKFSLSRHYNQKSEAPLLSAAFNMTGYSPSTCIISLSPRTKEVPVCVEKLPCRSTFKGIIFKDSELEALRISKGEKEWVLVIGHREYASPTDTFEAGGCVGCGQVVLFALHQGETRVGTVLEY